MCGRFRNVYSTDIVEKYTLSLGQYSYKIHLGEQNENTDTLQHDGKDVCSFNTPNGTDCYHFNFNVCFPLCVRNCSRLTLLLHTIP